jgi:NhaA family Na+:H+ antiporter
VVWLAFLKSGVHATIAGVLIAWTVPARNQIDLQAFVEQTHAAIHRLQGSKQQPSPMLTHEEQQSTVLELEDACEKVQAPLQKLEHSLHTPVSFLIMPIFALANAGVALSPASLAAETSAIPLGIIAGLVIGKPMGLLGAAWLATRFGLVVLPHGVRWQHMIGASFLAGVGFTMSLFIATLGYTSGERLEAAKLGILTASVIAGSVGYIWLRRLPAPEAD